MVNVLDLVAAATLTAFAREVPETVLNPLNQILPDVQIDSNEIEVGKRSRTQRTAKYRSFDAEAPIGARGVAAARSTIQLPPLSEKIPLSEKALLDLHKHGQSAVGAIVEEFYDDVVTAVTSLRNRAEKARGEFLSTGKISLNENGIVAEADFELPTSHKPTASVLWSNANADVIQDEVTWKGVVERAAQAPVQYALVSSRVLQAQLANQVYRDAYWGAAASTPPLTPDRLNEVRASYGLPPLFVYDGEVPSDSGMTRTVPDNLYIPVTGTLGKSAWGLTAEALELVASNATDFSAKDAPGIVVTQWRDQDPVTVWTKAASVFLPVADDINGLLVATVL